MHRKSSPLGHKATTPGHKVLFVDVGNSTLSPMAQAFARAFGIEADSAGTMPGGEFSHGAAVAMEQHGLALPDGRPKRIDFLRLADYERIIALDAGVAATSPDLHAHESWDLDDPVNLDFAAYRRAADHLATRVKALAQEIREWSEPEQSEELPAFAGY